MEAEDDYLEKCIKKINENKREIPYKPRWSKRIPSKIHGEDEEVILNSHLWP